MSIPSININWALIVFQTMLWSGNTWWQDWQSHCPMMPYARPHQPGSEHSTRQTSWRQGGQALPHCPGPHPQLPEAQEQEEAQNYEMAWIHTPAMPLIPGCKSFPSPRISFPISLNESLKIKCAAPEPETCRAQPGSASEPAPWPPPGGLASRSSSFLLWTNRWHDST